MSLIPVSTKLYNEFAVTGVTLADGSKVSPVSAELRNAPIEAKSDVEPVLWINSNQAYEFCNWLSHREGLEPCFQYREVPPQVASSANFAPAEIPWVVDESANGYRFPTLEQYIAAVQAGYSKGTPWAHVTEIGMIGGDYVPFVTDERIRPLHSLISNRRGLFVNDVKCGTFLCNHEKYASVHIWNKDYTTQLFQRRSLLEISIYLVQKVDAQD